MESWQLRYTIAITFASAKVAKRKKKAPTFNKMGISGANNSALLSIFRRSNTIACVNFSFFFFAKAHAHSRPEADKRGTKRRQCSMYCS